jgi:hypothetical protein
LIDAKKKRELWKGSAALPDADVEISRYVPVLNRKVLEFAVARKGKQVGNGECWTLVADALADAGARRDGTFGFGRELGPRDPIFPGDLIQFEKASFKGRHTANMPHHSAIVHEVKGTTALELIHQNYGSAGKTVSLTVIDLLEKKEGTLRIFRPRTGDEADSPESPARS